MKIVILAGGVSPERDVSLSSGSLIANSLLKSGYEVALVDLCGDLASQPEYRRGTAGKYSYTIPETPPDDVFLKTHRLIGEGVIEFCHTADVVFVALHGGIGENGELQKILERENIVFTGSASESCAVAMDKHLSKIRMAERGIATPPWVKIDTDSADNLPRISYPAVVKPCGCGSSVGVTMVNTPDELGNAIKTAADYGCGIIAEKRVFGNEYSVGVLDGKPLPAIEIIPKCGFYDFKNKYQPGMTQEICPAPSLSTEQAKILGERAVAVHNALGLGSYSRIDFIRENGEFYCLEANTLPGMTPSSLLPQEAAAAGISYDRLCIMIIEAALEK